MRSNARPDGDPGRQYEGPPDAPFDMDISADELAGVVDLFGALAREDLRRACVELAFKNGEDRDPGEFDGAIERAVESYHLVAVPTGEQAGDGGDGNGEASGTDDGVGVATGGGGVLVPGPAAFPELPEGATDLVHILDADERAVDREVVSRTAERRFRSEAAAAVEAGDGEAIRRLLDVSYELEAWGAVDLGETRARLDRALEGTG